MKSEHLFEAVGLVDDRLVEEAADARRTATPRRKWLAAAACLVVVLGLGSLALRTLRHPGRDDSSAMPPAAAESPAAAPAMEYATDSGVPGTDGAAEESAPAAAPAAAPEPEVEEAPAAIAPASGAEAQEEAEAAHDGAAEDVLGGTCAVPALYGGGKLTAARRDLTLDLENGRVLDRYTLENPADQAVTETFFCPLSEEMGASFAARLDGVSVSVTILDPIRASFEAAVPAGGAAELELEYPTGTSEGRFTLLPGGLPPEETVFRLLLPEGAVLTGSNLPGDPVRGPVFLDPREHSYEFLIED